MYNFFSLSFSVLLLLFYKYDINLLEYTLLYGNKSGAISLLQKIESLKLLYIIVWKHIGNCDLEESGILRLKYTLLYGNFPFLLSLRVFFVV